MDFTFDSLKKKEVMWTLGEGLKLVRELDKYARMQHFHLALGGGVLRAGDSYKDIDIYALPLHLPGITPNGTRLLELIDIALGVTHRLPDIANEDEAYFLQSQETRCHDLYIYEKPGKKIDFFIVRMTKEQDKVKW